MGALRACGVVLLLASSAGAEPFRAFECTRQILGKRSNGLERFRVEPTPTGAAFTLTFEAEQPECRFVARWRFPESVLVWRPEQAPAPRCEVSPRSPFAIDCRLHAPREPDDFMAVDFGTLLVLRATGVEETRRIGVTTRWPSAPVMPLPSEHCQALPVENGVVWMRHSDEMFDESECRLLPPRAK